MNIHYGVRASIKPKPFFPLIWCIPSFFFEFSFCTKHWIFIGTIKSSSWKRDKWFSSWLHLLCKEDVSIWQNRQNKSTINKSISLKSCNRSIVHLLIPLVNSVSYSLKNAFSMFWYDVMCRWVSHFVSQFDYREEDIFLKIQIPLDWRLFALIGKDLYHMEFRFFQEVRSFFEEKMEWT